MQVDRDLIAGEFRKLQDSICRGIEAFDGGQFKEDPWEREGGGGGLTRVLSGGGVIEKGGVNFSAVHGKTPEKIAAALGLSPGEFFATGVSIVLHPDNPFVPIIHMNVRYFEMSDQTWWFGGGIDLTPHYINPEDAGYFHHQLKTVCDRHDQSYYPDFKKWADDYFYIRHRDETRGVGGIFFDRLSQAEKFDKEARWNFVKDVGAVFLPTYAEIVQRNRERAFEPAHKVWQMLRRGRYVEFNLVYDKGTKFGLDTQGRTESILMSLPPQVEWAYDHHPAEGSDEASTLDQLRKGIDWVNYYRDGQPDRV